MNTRTIAIVGRPNVGKSALFNRIARRQISLVYDRPGVTRDRIVTTCRWEGHTFDLVDTGGIGLDDAEGFGDAIAREAEIALLTATDIIFVVDGREGLTPLDREVSERLRKVKQPIYVVANKLDDVKQDFFESEFVGLGFGTPLPASAAHGRGIDDILRTLTEKWPAPATEEEIAVEIAEKKARPTRLVIVGRPNVGKSSLINALIKDDRAMVSDVPGTTRDAVDVHFAWGDKPYTLIDTAGMRQERRINDELEQAMSGRSAHAINRADLCILVVDAQTGVSMQDKKIAGLISEAKRPCILVVNKWDLVRDQGDGGNARQREYFDIVQNDLFFISYAPVLFLSAKTGERVHGLMKTVEEVAATRHMRFPTGPLNRVLVRAQQRLAAPLLNGKRFRIYYAAQKPLEDQQDVPRLMLFVNDPMALTASYRRYLELAIREAFPAKGCPLIFELKAKTAADRGPGRPEPGQRHLAKSGIRREGPRRTFSKEHVTSNKGEKPALRQAQGETDSPFQKRQTKARRRERGETGGKNLESRMQKSAAGGPKRQGVRTWNRQGKKVEDRSGKSGGKGGSGSGTRSGAYGGSARTSSHTGNSGMIRRPEPGGGGRGPGSGSKGRKLKMKEKREQGGRRLGGPKGRGKGKG